VLALRRLPARRLVARPAVACGLTPRLHLGSQTRGWFGWGKSDDSGNGEGKAKGNEKSGDSKPLDAEKSEKSEKSISSTSTEALPSQENAAGNAAEATDGAIVSVTTPELDTDPPFSRHMMALPLMRRPLFPGQQQLVQVTHPVVVKALTNANDTNTPVFVAAFLRREETLSGNQRDMHVPAEDSHCTDPLKELFLTGTRARIVRTAPITSALKGASEHDAPQQGLQVLLSGMDLITMDKVLDLGPPLHVQVSKVQLEKVADVGPAADEVKAYINETIFTVREIMKINPQFREHATFIHQGMERLGRNDPHSIAHFAACLTTAAPAELMEVLETEAPGEKMMVALTLVKKELELSQLQHKITTQIEEKVSSHQREFMLREQLKMIKKELGEDKSDGSDTLLQKFKKRLEGKMVPTDAKEAIDSEVEKFSGLAKESQEYQITRNYLDWLTVLPWGVHTKDTLSLRKARDILDRDHYGLTDIKQRILEQIAVGTLRGSVQGKIICFVGPPGVGKTSIGKSIAQALGREFYRFSVGGLHDVAEIKGHRRTYVGAMPGKVVQCLKKTQSANPLVLIDEVDKIGRSHQGDPSSALLELLDPSQNSSFLDHYLDVPVDASKILFVCTANVTDTIPGPLLDRMEVIRLSGYDLEEKLKIAENYLVPSSMREMGLWPQVIDPPSGTTAVQTDASATDTKPDASTSPSALDEGAAAVTTENVDPAVPCESSASVESAVHAHHDVAVQAAIEKDALEALIRWYCREAGVRNLQKQIDKICRKLAMRVVEHREAHEGTEVVDAENKEDKSKAVVKDEKDTEAETLAPKVSSEPPKVVVTADGLSDLVGKPPFTSDRLYEGSLPAGTVTGLAWTSMGGSVLYMEATALARPKDKPMPPSLGITGQLGSVMKESSQLALLLARRQHAAVAMSSRSSFFEENEVHLHCPEGAVPKDGPSAGITMTTALLSLSLDTPIRVDLAMTGAGSLNGKVLAIGGLKEKCIAARRAGCKALVFPQANRRDFEELPAYLKDGLEVHFATDYSDVFSVAFPDYCKHSDTVCDSEA